jgi:serine/threonine-protein kinase RsbW
MGRQGSLTLSLDSRLPNVGFLGAAVGGICLLAGYGPPQADLLQLAVVEAVNNAIEHAYQGEPGNRVEVELRLKSGHLQFLISDRGRAMADPEPQEPSFDIEDLSSLPEGGLGLFLIHQIMDQVEYTSVAGKNTLSLTKMLPAS